MTRQAVTTSGAPAAIGAVQPGHRQRRPRVLLPASSGSTRRPASFVEGGVEAQAERALRNLTAVLDAAGVTLDDVVKTTIFLADIDDFAAVNAVYARYMPDPPPARSTFAVARAAEGRPASRSRPIARRGVSARPSARLDAPRGSPIPSGDQPMTPIRPPVGHRPPRGRRPLRARPTPRMNPPSPEPVSGHPGRPRPWSSRPASARACARACPRSSTRCAGDRCSPSSSTPGTRPPTRSASRPLGPSSSTHRPSRPSVPVFADRADVRPPGRAARDRRRRPRRARRRARRRRARSSSCPATCRSSRPTTSTPSWPPAATTTRPSPWPRSSPPTRRSSGRVVRSEFGTVERIVEAKDATEDELDGNEINAGLYAFDAEWLRRRIDTLAPSATTGELYLTELVRLAREDGRLVSAVAFEDDGRFDGINDRSQLAAAEWNLRVRRNEQHMRDGVTMRDPSTVYLDWDVTPRRGRHPRAERHPARRDVGRGGQRHRRRQPAHRQHGRRAMPGSGPAIVESSTIEDEATVGPFSHLRPGSVVGRGAEVGNFAELKNTRLGAGHQAAPHELPRRRRHRRAGQHRRRARSRPTTTARRSTARRSGTAPSSASTR